MYCISLPRPISRT